MVLLRDFTIRLREKKKAIIDFVLLEQGQRLPGWVDSDAKAYLDSLEMKIRRWAEQEKDGKKQTKARA